MQLEHRNFCTESNYPCNFRGITWTKNCWWLLGGKVGKCILRSFGWRCAGNGFPFLWDGEHGKGGQQMRWKLKRKVVDCVQAHGKLTHAPMLTYFHHAFLFQTALFSSIKHWHHNGALSSPSLALPPVIGHAQWPMTGGNNMAMPWALDQSVRQKLWVLDKKGFA